MAKYIKIRKENINIANNTSDILIGDVVAVKQGTNAAFNINAVTLFAADGKYYTLTVTAAAADWTKDLQYALTANPGGVMVVLAPSSTVKVSGLAVG